MERRSVWRPQGVCPRHLLFFINPSTCEAASISDLIPQFSRFRGVYLPNVKECKEYCQHKFDEFCKTALQNVIDTYFDKKVIESVKKPKKNADRITKYEQWILNYAYGLGWTSPTAIGRAYGNEKLKHTFHSYHSSWASPKCKSLVSKGLMVRNEKGWYKLTYKGMRMSEADWVV